MYKVSSASFILLSSLSVLGVLFRYIYFKYSYKCKQKMLLTFNTSGRLYSYTHFFLNSKPSETKV